MRIEIRSDSVVLDGYVNAVGRDSIAIPSPQGKFIEQIAPKAFQRALDRAENIELLLNHKKKLGSTKEGNLELYEDNIGLHARATVTDAEVIEKARRNELRGWSFGFYPEKERWEETPSGMKRRCVEDMELEEVTLADQSMIPLYVGTSLEMRAEGERMRETRGEDFQAVIETVSEKPTESSVDYSQYENEIKKIKERKI